MSYDRVNPTYYQTFQPGTPFQAGAPGWTQAPWPTWGDNPNLAGRARLATDGLGQTGCGCGASPDGLGKVVAVSGLDGLGLDGALGTYASLVGAAAGAYHGYQRNQTVGSAILWGIFGSVLPVIAIPVALAQGFGKRA